MKRMPKSSQRPINKPLWILLAVLVTIGMVLAWGLKSETQPQWKQQEGQWLMSEYGNFYALRQFYETQFPNKELQAFRVWNAKEPIFEDQTEHLLFIDQPNALSQDQFETLLAWIEKGNHVVMPLPAGFRITEDEEAEEDEFTARAIEEEYLDQNFQAAKVAQWAKIKPKPDIDWEKNPAPKNPACEGVLNNMLKAQQQLNANAKQNFPSDNLTKRCNEHMSNIALPEGKTLHYLPSNDRGFEVEKSSHLLWASQGANGSHIAHFRHGKGSLTINNSMSPFYIPTHPSYFDSDLNRADHAYLAAYLAQNATTIWFLQDVYQHTSANIPLWQKAWRFSPLLCVLLLGLTTLFIWRHAYRLGSIQQLNTHQTRQLTHYFRSQGEFLWQKKQAQKSLGLLQQQLWTQWQRRIPNLSSMDKKTQLQALIRVYPELEDELNLWVRPIPSELTAQQWRQYLQAHQNLRNAL